MKRAMLSIACALGLAAAAVPGSMAAPLASGSSLEGFGKDLPLTFAVKQIVPQGYTVNFGPGVDRNTHISWSGGMPWRDVLETAVHTQGLYVAYEGRTVRINEGSGHSNMASVPGAIASTDQRGGLIMVPYHAAPALLPLTPAPVPTPVPAPPVMAPVAHPPLPALPEASVPRPTAPVVVSEAKPAPLPAREVPVKLPAVPVVPTPPPVMAPVVQQSPPAARVASIPVQVRRNGLISRAPQDPVSSGPTSGVGRWHAAAHETLDQVLGDWADKAGWSIVFNSKMIYELQASADFEGDFTEAASSLVKSIRANPQPLATFYRGNRALVITNSADQTN